MEGHLLRLATFSSFPESASLSPCVASKAGLYYTGEGDTVACYSCGLRLNHGESGVHPMTVHRRLSPLCQFVVSQPTDNGSAEQENTETVSADELVSQSTPTRSRRESPQVSQSHNHQRRRRRGYNSRHDYYSQLASVAGSLHASTGTSTEWTSYASSPFSSTHVYTNVDRFTSRRMRERINNNDPVLLEEMKYENQRLSSFANWRRDTNIQPEALAQAGLFYLCRADRVKCAFCGGILRNWGPSEDPMRKHRNLFPRCTFLRDPRAAGNVAIGDEPTEEQLMNVTMNTTNSSSTGELGIETTRPKHPTKSVEAVQLASFDRWPRSCPVTPDSLAHAGFYYTGVPNAVCCFFCDGRLNSLQQNVDPMTEHRRLFPQCGFLRITRDNEQIATTQSTHESATGTTTAASATAVTGQGNSDAPTQNPTLTCTVCLDAQKTILFLPCGHLACCANCASALTSCPICRSEIKGSVRTYLA